MGTMNPDCFANMQRCIEFLQENGCTEGDMDGLFRLMVAIKAGNEKKVAALCAAVPWIVVQKDYDHRTPLHIAVEGEKTDIILSLLNRMDQLKKTNKSENQSEVKDRWGKTPLDYAKA